MIRVLRAGPLTTVQDLGRPGLGHLGVGRSGAADRASLRLANRLVGNREGAAGLELTLGGLSARFADRAVIALAGAPVPAEVCGRQAPLHASVRVDGGCELRLGTPARGLRTYLAVRGGIDVPPVLGSRSTDVLGGLGPDVVRDGADLGIGRDVAELPVVDVAPVPPLPDEVTLLARPGPRDDWFARAALRALTAAPYEVTTDSNRIGLRLAGPRLERARAGELPPEGMVEGALQVPPSGQPILFLADHPVTGGYPVIAVVRAEDIGAAAQLRPGQRVRFRVGR